MNLSKIHIKNHALQRFKERWIKFYGTPPPENWYDTLKNLLSDVIEIKKTAKSRLENFEKYKKVSRYFLKTKSWNWIFVTNENATKLFTIEWIKINPQSWAIPKGIRKKIKKRRI